METLKEDDFVEIDFTGKIADDGIVFDTTLGEEAKKANIHDAKIKYEPVRICLGQKHLIPGLDKNLIGKETGKDYAFRIPAEDGFGNKNPKLFRLIATGKFHAQEINPVPGLQVNMDGVIGTIKSVSGGRTIVDFNHPLSGKELEYKVRVNKKITDVAEKAEALARLIHVNVKARIDGENAILEGEVPKEKQEMLTETIKKTIKEIKSISFQQVTKKPENKTQVNNKI